MCVVVVCFTRGGDGTVVGTQLHVQVAPGGTGAPQGSVRYSHVFVCVLKTFTFTLSPLLAGGSGCGRAGGFRLTQPVAAARTDAMASPLPRKPRLPALASHGTSVTGMICGALCVPSLWMERSS